MARTTGSHSEITGPKVRAAALRLFAKGGYAAVSMRSIAAEVGVQAGALYNYISDKQTLLFDLMRSHMEALLEQSTETTGSATERLNAFVVFHIRFHATRPDEVFLSYMELRNLAPQNFDKIEFLRRQYEDRLERILQAGVRTGEFQVQDTKIATLAIIAMLTGMNTWFRESGRLSLEEVAAQYWHMVHNAVRTPEQNAADVASALSPL